MERTVRAIRADDSLKVEVRLDRDTPNVACSPAIADTILEKISRAAVFVPDVSIVARTREGEFQTSFQTRTVKPHLICSDHCLLRAVNRKVAGSL